MSPARLVDTARTPDGAQVTLERDGEAWTVYVDGAVLMSSRAHGSEEAMALLACGPLAEAPGACVLVGGLGLGYTLRAALDVLGPDARVHVAELLPAIVRWHREGPLGGLAGRPLDDPRVVLEPTDVRVPLRRGPGMFDAILLDVDNGPLALTSRGNGWLYAGEGLRTLAAALAPGGLLVVWSAFRDAAFEARLAEVGLAARTIETGAEGRTDRRSRHHLFVGEAPGGRPRRRRR